MNFPRPALPMWLPLYTAGAQICTGYFVSTDLSTPNHVFRPYNKVQGMDKQSSAKPAPVPFLLFCPSVSPRCFITTKWSCSHLWCILLLALAPEWHGPSTSAPCSLGVLIMLYSMFTIPSTMAQA